MQSFCTHTHFLPGPPVCQGRSCRRKSSLCMHLYAERRHFGMTQTSLPTRPYPRQYGPCYTTKAPCQVAKAPCPGRSSALPASLQRPAHVPTAPCRSHHQTTPRLIPKQYRSNHFASSLNHAGATTSSETTVQILQGDRHEDRSPVRVTVRPARCEESIDELVHFRHR